MRDSLIRNTPSSPTPMELQLQTWTEATYPVRSHVSGSLGSCVNSHGSFLLLSPFSFFSFYRAFFSHSARAEEIASGNGRGNSFRVGKVGAARPPPNGNPSCDGVRSHATISHWKLRECASFRCYPVRESRRREE